MLVATIANVYFLGTGHEKNKTQTVVNVELGECATSEDFRAAYTDVILPSVFVFVELAEFLDNIAVMLLILSRISL